LASDFGFKEILLKGFVAVTDNDWFNYLSQKAGIDEVNFWQPGGSSRFKILMPGEPFLFKLHAPLNFIVGGGFFTHNTTLPISLAWQAFREKNGAETLQEMRKRTEKYRRTKSSPFEDYKIGCILLAQPFFLKEEEWIPSPLDFSLNIVQGKSYDLTQGNGLHLWEEVKARLGKPKIYPLDKDIRIAEPETRYGEPTLILPRLGQGSFRILVTDVYNRRCSVTRERTLPALEAVHIKPFGKSGPHSINNGILFRSDIHKLFDTGYVTISADYHFEVSKSIKEEFENGRDYYAMHGKQLELPPERKLQPASEFISWHNENVFRG
jgi:putative restriction endonuclease